MPAGQGKHACIGPAARAAEDIIPNAINKKILPIAIPRPEMESGVL
jgi:hypothetical protein